MTLEVRALIDKLAGPDLDERHRAARGLGELGPAAAPAVAALAVALGDEDEELARLAAGALGRIGAAAKTALGPLVRAQRRPAIVDAATRAFGEIRAAMPQRRTAGRGAPTPYERYREASARWHRDRDTQAALAVLLPMMDTEDWDQGRAVAISLGQIGSGEAAPALAEALGSECGDVRCVVAEALGQIGPPARAVAPALRAALARETAGEIVRDDRVRLALALALWRIAEDAHSAVPALLDLLRADDRQWESINDDGALRFRFGRRTAEERCAVLRAFGEIGPAATVATTTLEAVRDEGDPDLRAAASDALERITGRRR